MTPQEIQIAVAEEMGWKRDDRAEFKPRKPKRYRCLDRLCGATDCTNCYPDQRDEKEEDEP